LDLVVFGNITVLHLLIGVVAMIALSTVVGRARKLFARSAVDEKLQRVECKACGWQGRVSRIAGRCPNCNEPLGDRKAERER
jgi:predicted Zn-ribbon and HTH transcriptional regulator